MVALLGNLLLTIVLVATSWFVLVGGTGAFIAFSLGFSPVLGFIVSSVVPVPPLGWLAVWLFATHSTGSNSVAGGIDTFANPDVGYGKAP